MGRLKAQRVQLQQPVLIAPTPRTTLHLALNLVTHQKNQSPARKSHRKMAIIDSRLVSGISVFMLAYGACQAQSVLYQQNYCCAYTT